MVIHKDEVEKILDALATNEHCKILTNKGKKPAFKYWMLEKDGTITGTNDVNLYNTRRYEQEKNHVVGNKMVGKLRVSTVFLGIDHNHGWGKYAVLFETMIFGITDRKGNVREWQRRYESLHDAKQGHKRAVLLAQRVWRLMNRRNP